MGISVFFIISFYFAIKKIKENRIRYLAFIGAQKQKSDFPSFGGVFKKSHIYVIFNFEALMFWEKVACWSTFIYQTTKKIHFSNYHTLPQFSPFLQTMTRK